MPQHGSSDGNSRLLLQKTAFVPYAIVTDRLVDSQFVDDPLTRQAQVHPQRDSILSTTSLAGAILGRADFQISDEQ